MLDFRLESATYLNARAFVEGESRESSFQAEPASQSCGTGTGRAKFFGWLIRQWTAFLSLRSDPSRKALTASRALPPYNWSDAVVQSYFVVNLAQ